MCNIRNLFRMGMKQSKPIKCGYFPFLNDDDTVDAIKEANTLFILRGLPGSGKSTIGQRIRQKYPQITAIASADQLEISPMAEESEAEGNRYAKLDTQIQQYFKESKGLIVVDDTHHIRKRLEYLFDLARDNDYIVIIVTPKTEWRDDCQSLANHSSWKPPVEKLTLMQSSYEQHIIPDFFGFFLLRRSSEEMRETAEDFLNLLSQNDIFITEFVKNVEWHSEEGFNLQEYFQKRPSVLHCTTKFCNYGTVPGCETYARCKAVEHYYSKSFVLKVIALFITPRTVGAHLLLSKQQQELWPKEEVAEDDGYYRSHITLACAPGEKAVTTGLDLLEFLRLEKMGSMPEHLVEMKKGELRCYGKGMWIVKLSKPIEVKTLFCGSYTKEKVQPTTEGN
uniref:2',3'-cyclic-nucleotide 3'-phosphodiesterase isoform X2 n=1 Tax=Pristiophorus japonicus TaxID=55135 RepID=UPI00398EBFDF